MKRRFLALDIEIAKVLPNDERDLKSHRPLGICCAGVLAEDEDQVHLWYSNNPDGSPAAQMSRQDVSKLVDFVRHHVADGYTVVTWNGLGFDFDIIAEESGRWAECQQLSVDHVDAMFHVFCLNGFPVGLDAAAKGIGLNGKPLGMNATMAPKRWAACDIQDVLDYLAQDCKMTIDVAKASERHQSFRWVTRRGNIADVDLHGGCWKTVREAIQLPEPDTSWMSRPPWPRSRFTSWWSDLAQSADES